MNGAAHVARSEELAHDIVEHLHLVRLDGDRRGPRRLTVVQRVKGERCYLRGGAAVEDAHVGPPQRCTGNQVGDPGHHILRRGDLSERGGGYEQLITGPVVDDRGVGRDLTGASGDPYFDPAIVECDVVLREQRVELLLLTRPQ